MSIACHGLNKSIRAFRWGCRYVFNGVTCLTFITGRPTVHAIIAMCIPTAVSVMVRRRPENQFDFKAWPNSSFAWNPGSTLTDKYCDGAFMHAYLIPLPLASASPNLIPAPLWSPPLTALLVYNNAVVTCNHPYTLHQALPKAVFSWNLFPLIPTPLAYNNACSSDPRPPLVPAPHCLACLQQCSGEA